MAEAIGRDLLESYSRGELTRREIADRINQPVSFGTLLDLLHRHGLPLPRIASDPDSPGVRLVTELARRAKHRAG